MLECPSGANAFIHNMLWAVAGGLSVVAMQLLRDPNNHGYFYFLFNRSSESISDDQKIGQAPHAVTKNVERQAK